MSVPADIGETDGENPGTQAQRIDIFTPIFVLMCIESQ